MVHETSLKRPVLTTRREAAADSGGAAVAVPTRSCLLEHSFLTESPCVFCGAVT